MDPYVAGNSEQPLLPQMVNKALSVLQHNNNAGLFLMVEGALIDKLSHANNPNFAAEEAQLDLAAHEAFDWANRTGQNLLVLVTADHETDGVSVPDGQSHLPGTIPTLTFSITGHTGADVPLYGNWPSGLQGQTIDNTEVFHIMQHYLEGGKPPQITDLSVTRITEATASIRWNTTELSDSRVVLSGLAKAFASTVRVNAHTLLCTGLQPGATYTVTASSTDLAGYTGTATVTLPGNDSTPITDCSGHTPPGRSAFGGLMLLITGSVNTPITALTRAGNVTPMSKLSGREKLNVLPLSPSQRANERGLGEFCRVGYNRSG